MPKNQAKKPNNQQNKDKKKKPGNFPPRLSFLNVLALVILIFLLITAVYSQFSDSRTASATPTSLSAVAQDINKGKINSIAIQGDRVLVTYNDKSVKVTQKEADSSLTDSLSKLGVNPNALASTTVTVESPSGFWYWVGQLSPFLAPLLFLVFFVWLISRQMRGAGIQALSFGQSKARITLPDDQKQKVTFKDVAGAKEAKQELLEIVDFLRNPKKFIEIGAEIPKGVLLMGAPGTGKCITGDSLVNTNKGLVRIDQIPKYFAVDPDGAVHGVEVKSFNPVSMQFEDSVASHWYDLGVQKTKRLTAENGAHIEGTFEHPIVIVNEKTGLLEFRKISEIKKGEFAVFASKTNNFGSSRELIRTVWTQSLGYTVQVLNRAFYSQSLYKNVARYLRGERVPSVSGMNHFIEGVVTLAPTIADSSQLGFLKQISSGDFFFGKIEKIENSESRVYDMTVPGLHNFVANGFINHNTLLARAVAGEANVAFFSISGSEFVEMFVGVGASRVRDLFKMAKDAAPSIVFVDEIDAVGRARGSGVGGGNDEREQTLNQILVEMDGFEPNVKVIVMAATNRPDVLDPALLRPGRFDRRVVIDLPDRSDREEILKIHAARKQLAEDVNLRVVAERTPGFSGADLQSLMNEAAILAARENRTRIGQFDLIRSIEKVMLGPERRSHILSPKEKEITAYHEAGHALVSSVLPHADPVHKISIISRGRAAGYTLKLPFEERRLQSRKEFLDDIAVSLGGYVAEKMMFGDLTTGASNDLQVSTALARSMITQYGMSDKIGPVALESASGRVLFGAGVNDREYSERVAAEIDGEITRIMTEARELALKTLTENKKAFEAVAKRLIEVETIEREEYEKILVAQGVPVKKGDEKIVKQEVDIVG
jgi:ATP-dependent metalloprotease FtsH